MQFVEPLEPRRLLSSSYIELPGGSVAGEIAFRHKTFYAGDDGMYVTDGTVAGSKFLHSFKQIQVWVTPKATANGYLFFAGDDGITGLELWRTDGTADGTQMVADINPGQYGSNLSLQLAYGGKVYFTAYDPIHGHEPYASDGTAEGTLLLGDFAAESAGPRRISFGVSADKRVYFTAEEQPNDFQAWATEGTPGTTSKINLGNSLEFPHDYLAFKHKTYFVNHNQLWKTNGTAAGTSRVFSVGPTRANEWIESLFAFRGQLMFIVYLQTPSALKSSIFMSDGTTAGTHRIASFGAKSLMISRAVTRRHLFFTVRTPDFKNSLWTSDGTRLGTMKIGDLGAGNVTYIAPGSSKAFFATENLAAGEKPRIWQTDGTASGTKVITRLPHFDEFHSLSPVYVNNSLYVAISFNPAHGTPAPPSHLYLVKTT